MRPFMLFAAGVIAAPISAQPSNTAPPARAEVESSLPTAGGHIRQFAFDGDANTYFASEGNAKKGDHLTIAFDKAVPLKSITVVTGRPDGTELLTSGALEVSRDGKSFTPLGTLAEGTATNERLTTSVKAVRVRATKDHPHPLGRVDESVFRPDP